MTRRQGKITSQSLRKVVLRTSYGQPFRRSLHISYLR